MLTVAFQQTPFLTLLPDPRVQRTLRLLKRTPDVAVTGDVARELCERAGATAVVNGSIAASGSTMTIELTVNQCKTGAQMATKSVTASGRDGVLAEVEGLTRSVRKQLGEPADSIEQYRAPLTQALTSSLEALQAYGQGLRMRAIRGDEAAIPFFRKAIAQDAAFALAHAKLGVVTSNIGEVDVAREEARKAHELRAKVTEYERLYIDWNYASRVLADQKAVKDALEKLTTTYPRDFAARNNFGVYYNNNGQVEEALKEYRAASEIAPDEPGPLSNSAYALLLLGRHDEASDMVDRALVIRPEPNLAITRWISARVLGLPRAAEFETAARNLAAPQQMALAEASLAAWFGQFQKFTKLQDDLIASAKATASADLADAVAVGKMLTLATYRRGQDLAALKAAAAREKNLGFLAQQTSALAMLGDLASVRAGLTRLTADPASSTFGPPLIVARAYVQASEGQTAAALAALQAALVANPRARDMHYFMADIREQTGDIDGAIAGYRAMIDSLTYLGPNPLIPTARLRLAKLLLKKNDSAGAKEHLDVLLKQWKYADTEFPALTEAKALRAGLQ